MTITTQEARAIKHADSICFDHVNVDGEGTGRIRAIRRASATQSGFEETVTITLPVGHSRVQNYGTDRGWFVGFSMVMSAQYDAIWQTVARQIRAGSSVGLRWTRDNSSPVTNEAGLVVDMLDIVVQNGRVANTYRIATYVGYDNTARMLRRDLTVDLTTDPVQA